MKLTKFPVTDPNLTKESVSIKMVDSDDDRHYQNILKFGSKIFSPSVSFLSLADYCKQWFKAIMGFSATEGAGTAPTSSLSKGAASMFVVKEEKEEAVYYNPSFNSLVRKNSHVQFNNVFPLKASDEHSDGAFGIIDTREKNQKARKDALFHPEKSRIRHPEFRKYKPDAPVAPEKDEAQALWHEAAQLAKICSWEYTVASQKFLCTDYVHSLLRIPKEKSVAGFHTFLQYFIEEDRAKLSHSWSKILRFGEELEYDTRLKQEGVWIRIKIKPVFKDSTILKIVGTLQDVTDVKENELKLIAEKGKAEQATKVKSEFVSLMSHEIRTPLNAIMGLTHLLLQEENTPQECKENLQSIHFSSQNMLALINNTLDYSRMEAGKIELEKVNFQLKDLLKNIHRSLAIRAEEKQLKFELQIDENTPSEVAGDPARLTQVMNNLMSNAIKFTEKGSVTLSVDVVYQSDSDWVLEFTVSDTGLGIPEDKQQLIFDSFVQASAATHRQYGGTGLGLAITKKIVELQNGSIQLKSKLGVGSVFSVRLRFVRPDKSFGSIRMIGPGEKQESNLKGAKVLVIDDNAINNMVASKLLISWEAEVETAEDGFAAIEKIKSSTYDLILMDLHMPVLNGFDAIAEIRRLGYTIPIIALTANSSEEEKKRIAAIGGNDYLTKPFVPEQLHDMLQQHLQPQNA